MAENSFTTETNVPSNIDIDLQAQQNYLSEFVENLEVQQFLEEFIQSHKYNRDSSITEPSKQTVTVAVLGKTGSGKSSTCNTLVGINGKFRTGKGQFAVTMETKMEDAILQMEETAESEYLVQAIDTPGFFDINPVGDEQIKCIREEITKMEDKGDLGEVYAEKKKQLRLLEKSQQQVRQSQIESDIRKCLERASGISAFFIVISLTERLGPETLEMLHILLNLFGGKHFKNRAFVVLTHLDEIGMTEEEYIQQDEFHPIVKDFLTEINHRCIFVNNDLIKKIDKADEAYKWRQSCFQKVINNLAKQKIHPYGNWHSQIPRLSEQQIRLEKSLQNLVQKRNNVELEINQFWQEYSVHRNNTVIANTVGAGISLGVGVPLTIAGLCLAIPTFGVTSVLMIAGATISVSGGLTAGGASIANIFTKRDATGKSDASIKEFTLAVDKFQQTYDEVEQNFLNILENFCSYTAAEEKLSDQFPQGGKNIIAATAFLQTVLTGGRVAFQITASLSDDFLKAIGVIGLKAVPIVGVVIGTLLDIATIVQAVRKSNNTDKCYEEQFKAKINECNNNFGELCKRVENLKATIQKFCEDPDRFMRNLFDSLEIYYTCCICQGFCIDIQPCLIGKKHNSGCVECLKNWHISQLDRHEIPTCPVCEQHWPVTINR